MKFYKKFKELDKFTKLSIYVISIGIILRFLITFFVMPSGDSTWHLAVARFMARNNYIPLFENLGRSVFWAPPLFHLIAASFYKIFSVFGENIALKSMDFVMPIFGSLTLIVFHKISGHFFKRKKLVFLADCFLAFIPIHIYYSTISHIDGFLTFWVLLASYLAIKKKFFLCSIVSGVGMLSKYNFMFIFPLIVYYISSNSGFKIVKTFLKSVRYFAIVLLIGLPWYIRNTIYLGNPVFYFMNPFFKFLGFNPILFQETMRPHGLMNLFYFSNITKVFFDFYGVPLGLVNNLKNINLPLMPFPLIIWFSIISIFTLIMIYSFFVKKTYKLNIYFYLYSVPFLIMLLLYVYDFADIYLRLYLPAIPLLGLFFAVAVDKLSKTKIKTLLVFFLIISFILFSAGELYKVNVASSYHKAYLDDWQWIKNNTLENETIYPDSQVLLYYTERPLSERPNYYIETDYTPKYESLNTSMLDTVLVYNGSRVNVYKINYSG